MEKPIQIALNILNNQEIIGKEYLTINEVKEILYDVDKMFNKKDFATKEQRDVFNNIMSRITETKKIDKYPNFLFYKIGGYCYIERNIRLDKFYISFEFWDKFEMEFKLNYNEISELLRGLLSEYFKCEVNSVNCSIKDVASEKYDEDFSLDYLNKIYF